MDRITSGLLSEFCSEFALSSFAEDKQFETFATYVAVRRHFSEATFDPSTLITGDGGDTGIDGIAVIVNNNLVGEIDDVDELLKINGYVDAKFIFVQAERTSGFDAAKIGTFGFGVRDFFGTGTLVRNDKIKKFLAIANAVFARSARFTKGNPSIDMYYITTGKWGGDQNLVARYQSEINYLTETGNFSGVNFVSVGADLLQRYYNQTKNAITREFLFERKTVIPNIHNVNAAYVGFLPAADFLRIISDEDDNLIESLFYENVRGWEGYNTINNEMRATLESDDNDRFVLMNNGITIITKSLLTTGDKFTMGDFQIVNGCQTSNVLHDNRAKLTEAVRIPIRIIFTTDDAVAESVITATNRQTEIKSEQFFALKDFAKKLEAYFKSFEPGQKLYYERRTHQYDSQSIDKTRVITHRDLVRAVAAMFFEEPHRTSRGYKEMSERVGQDMFLSTDRAEPYYVAGFALYKINEAFKNARLANDLKIARYQILLTLRLLVDAAALPRMNSNEMERRCQTIMERLWKGPDELLTEAAGRLSAIVNNNMDRDYVHTQAVTNAILDAFRPKGGAV